MAFKVLAYFSIVFIISIKCDEPQIKIMKYDEEFNLQCSENTDKSDQIRVDWYKVDDKGVSNKIDDGKHIKIWDEGSKLTIPYPKPGDEGTYVCDKVNVTDGSVVKQNFTVLGKAYVRVSDDDIAVIEGETFTVECKAVGTKPIDISWIVGNETYTSSKDRVKLSTTEEQGIKNNVLELELVEMSDRGNITCLGNNSGVIEGDKPNEAIVYVRVKDQYAAVWPFLGLVLETIVLVVMIVVCEKYYKKDYNGGSSDEEENSATKNMDEDDVKDSDLN